MEWNYRIIKHETGKAAYYAVHEVYYDEAGNVTTWTAEPIDLTGDNKRDITHQLKTILQDIEQPVLRETELLQKVGEK